MTSVITPGRPNEVKSPYGQWSWCCRINMFSVCVSSKLQHQNACNKSSSHHLLNYINTADLTLQQSPFAQQTGAWGPLHPLTAFLRPVFAWHVKSCCITQVFTAYCPKNTESKVLPQNRPRPHLTQMTEVLPFQEIAQDNSTYSQNWANHSLTDSRNLPLLRDQLYKEVFFNAIGFRFFLENSKNRRTPKLF